jgi:S1-C subfamily serine protease
LVVEVIPDSPAAQSGLQRGDVITQVGEEQIATAEQLQTVVEKSEIGKPLPIKIIRARQNETILVIPQELREIKNN